MRRRLLVSAILIALIAATLFGVPVVVFSQRYLRAEHLEQVGGDAQRIARRVAARLAAGDPLTVEGLRGPARPEEEVVIVRGDHVLVRFGPDVSGPGAITADATAPSGVLVRVSQPGDLVLEEMARLRLLVLGFGGAAVLVAIAVGAAQARRLSRSLVDLADTAERLGSGDSRPRGRRYGVPELDRVAEVLDDSAARISQLLAAERQLSQNASHQLRSPLTALSMRLEEILVAEDGDAVREEARIALGQVERLTEVVDRLLAPSKVAKAGRAPVVDVAVDEVVDQQVIEWRPAFDAAGRVVRITGQPGLHVSTPRGLLGQVLATLLENALDHGRGEVVVRRRTTELDGHGAPGPSVVVEVGDEGLGVPGHLGQRIFEREVSGRRGTGLGLALARDLAESAGGRLELVSRRPAVFAVFLPPGGDGVPGGR